MSILYPVTFPAHTGLASVGFRMVNTTAVSESPFTGVQQVQGYSRQRWEADVTLPPLKHADAVKWIAFLASLRGRFGTFTMGDPMATKPRGTALGGRVNLFNYSEQFDNAYWSKVRASATANATTAPDGFSTADALIEDTTATNNHYAAAIVSVETDVPYSMSVYIKAMAGRNVRLSLPSTFFGGVSTGATFDASTGAVISVSSGTVAATESVGGGWYRVSVSKVATATGSITVSILLSNGSSTTYTGDGTSGVYLWGAQFDANDPPAAYQPIHSTYGPFINGAGQTGPTVVIDGASPNETGYLLAGDYVQIGNGLHRVLTDVDTDESGNATLEIWPSLRSSPANDTQVVLENPVGRFRLMADDPAWNVNSASIYGISFTAMEAF